MASSTVIAFARRRPATCISLASGVGLASYASLVEYVANRRERIYLEQQRIQFDANRPLPSTPLLPRDFDFDAINSYWRHRPVSTLKRFCHVATELTPLLVVYLKDYVIKPARDNEENLHADLSAAEKQQKAQRDIAFASKLREALTNLGPAFVKAGQQLSIRPDLVPPTMLREFQKLCDAVRPFDDNVAMDLIRYELNVQDLDTIFSSLTLVASASLGQVYKATLVKSDIIPFPATVAVKVQRPDMRRSFSLDLFLLQKIGALVDVFTSIFTNQPPFHQPLYEAFARGSYSELDYEKEAFNQIVFRDEFKKRNCPVIVPNVYKQFSSERVLTSEWIDGVNLTDAPRDVIQKLVPVGVELFLTQLLDIGRFHCDPHGANLLVTKEGQLALLDFGLCAEVDEKARRAMTAAIVHLITRDFDALLESDAKDLGVLPQDFDIAELKPIIIKILTIGVVESSGSDMRKRKRKLMEISNELNEVFFRFPFSVPPFFALVTRGLGLLEGIALTGDPEFDIFRASAPYARKRAMALLGRHTFQENKLKGK